MNKLYKTLFTCLLSTVSISAADASLPNASESSNSPAIAAMPFKRKIALHLSHLEHLFQAQSQDHVLSFIDELEYLAHPDYARVAASLLHLAIKEKNREAISLMLDKGVNIDGTDLWTPSPLTKVIKQKNIAMLKFLLEKGANPDQPSESLSGFRPIQTAALEGDFEIFKVVWEACEIKTPKDKSGSTLMHFAAAGGNVSILEFLKNKGLSCTERDSSGHTPLHEATVSGRVSAIHFLLENGAEQEAIVVMDNNLLLVS